MQSSGKTHLPKIRFSSLPRPVWEHILDRVEERQISLHDLRRLQNWVNASPLAPDGDWYKDFGSFIICGSGEFPKPYWPRAWCPSGLGSSSDYARTANSERRQAVTDALRIQPTRSAILLIGGEKTGDGRWYEKFVPIADRIFERHLLELKKEENT